MNKYFEWDEAKAAENFAKHGTSFLEAVWYSLRSGTFPCVSSARAPQRGVNVTTMRKTSVRKKLEAHRDGIRKEYRFDYSKAKPNRFASQMKGDTVAVILDPDVAPLFKSSESVNAALRAITASRRSSGSRN